MATPNGLSTLSALLASLIATAAIGAGTLAPPPPAAEPPFPIDEPEGPVVEATLWVEKGQVNPGAVVWVAVAFKIRPEWHIYWPGVNDTGMAPTFDWRLPDGWKIGAPRWPAPTRHVAPGDMVDHILEGIPTVLFPVKIPESADAGSAATISCDIEWLVCRSICIAERERVQFSFAPFNVNNQSTNTRAQDAAVIAMARRALPLPSDAADAGIVATVIGNTLTIRCANGGALSFAPSDSGRPVFETFESCVGGAGEPLFVGLEDAADLPVEGVVTVKEFGRPTRSFTLRIPQITDAQRDGFEITQTASRP